MSRRPWSMDTAPFPSGRSTRQRLSFKVRHPGGIILLARIEHQYIVIRPRARRRGLLAAGAEFKVAHIVIGEDHRVEKVPVPGVRTCRTPSHVGFDAMLMHPTDRASRRSHGRPPGGGVGSGAKRSIDRSIMRFPGGTSAWRITVITSTSTMIAFSTSIRMSSSVSKEGPLRHELRCGVPPISRRDDFSAVSVAAPRRRVRLAPARSPEQASQWLQREPFLALDAPFPVRVPP